jgi:hypothetical protein
MRFKKIITRFILPIFIASLLPLNAVTLADFDNAFTSIKSKNITQGDTVYSTTVSANPGDEISLTSAIYNFSGAATTLKSFASMSKPDNFTYIPNSLYWAWDTATANLNDGKGEVMFPLFYIDNDSSGKVNTGDIRVNTYGVNATMTDGKYTAGSMVAASDYDDGDDLSDSAIDYLYITGGDTDWIAGEFVYAKGVGNNNLADIQIGDIRVVANGSYLKGSIVASGDGDIAIGALTQAANIHRRDDNNSANDNRWPLDEGGFPLGDIPADGYISFNSFNIVIDQNSSSLTQPTITFTSDNTSSVSRNCEINIDTTPSVSSVVFTPGTIINDGVSATKVEVIANDKNGISDLVSVTIDLSLLGGSATATLYDDGSHGDTIASDGVWSLNGITTAATAGNYTSIPATATDSTAQTAGEVGNLIVQAGGTPVFTINSATPTTIGNTGDVTFKWEADEGIWMYEVRIGGCGGNLAIGSNVALGDGSAEILAANTEITSTIDNANFNAGNNQLHVCGSDADGNSGQNFATITKDLTSPTVTIASITPSTVSTGGVATLTWSANESGSYEARVGGSDCSNGNLATGNNASGSYTAGSGNILSAIPVADLGNEGSNTIRVCVTDAVNNTGNSTTTVSRDTTPPDSVSNVVLVDNDNANDGVDGRDISITWNPTSNDASFSNYRIYLLPNGIAFDIAIHATIAVLSGNQSTNNFTGSAALKIDSENNPLIAGDYVAYVVAIDNSNQKSTEAASAAATLIMDDLSPPSFASANTVDTETLKITFSEEISFVDTNKITATGLTIDAAYNSGGYTNGYKIDSDAKNLFLRINPIATDYTANDLAFAACAVRDITGNLELNEGSCGDATPITNANAAESGKTISDGCGVDITLTSPANSGSDNNTIAVDYTLSETAQAGSLRLKFIATGGNADAASPHTIMLSDDLVCGGVSGCHRSSGNHTFTLDGGDFTSIENSDNDLLIDGSIYTVELVGSDALSNVGIPAQNTDWIFDITSPTPPVATQGFSTPTRNTTPQFDWSSVSDAVSYRFVLSLQATNYSPSFTSQVVNSPDTSWILNPAFANDGSMDDVYIWKVYATDAAGNESIASNQLTFTLNTQTSTPSIIIKDATSNSPTFTNSDAVNITLEGYQDDVTHYLLSETQNTQPAAGLITTAIPGVAAQTVAFTFTNANEELKTVYVWVKDGLGNISENVSSATITLDSTPLPQPTITATDADNGSEAGKTNAATVKITIGDDTDAAKWCVGSITNGNPITTPTESGCSNAVMGSSAASGWIGSKPTTHTLASTGNKDIYTWVMDTAGNISPASAAATIDYNDATPPLPAITLQDETSGSQSFTNSQTVAVNITNDATAWKWIVSETITSQPSEGSVSWGNEINTFNLTSGDASKVVYVWIKDVYGNVSDAQSFASIKLDTTIPTFSVIKTQDLDDDGEIDAMQITMNEAILDNNISPANFSFGSGYAVENITGSRGVLSFVNGVSTGSNVDDAIFYIAITEKGSIDTDVKPTLTYTQGNLNDTAENLAASLAANNSTDGVKPRLIADKPIRIFDEDGNGKADVVKVIFSESLATTTATTPWMLANTPSAGSLDSVSVATTNTANDTVVLHLTEGNSAADTTAGSFTVSLDNNSSEVADSANNNASDFTAINGEDYMGVAIVAANYISTGNAANDSITVNFSESVDDASMDIPTDFTVANGGSIANANFNTGNTADDNSIVIELNAGDSALGVGNSTVRFSAAGVANDNSAQSNTNNNTTAVTVGGGLIINEISWSGSSGKATDEWIELRNLSGNAIDFNTNYYCVYVGSSKLADLSGSIAGSDYYLISHYAETDVNSALNVTPNLIPAIWVEIPDTDLQINLYSSIDATCDNTDNLIDNADDGVGIPFAGNAGINPASMERNVSVGVGNSESSWHTAAESSGMDDANQKATPLSANISDITAPSFDTASRYPSHQSLLPSSPASISVSYTDNAGGVGVDAATATMEIDLNGDGDFTDAGEGVGGICSGGNLTATTTEVVCNLTTTLAAGKHSVRVSVSDNSGNANNTVWDFWVDNFTFKVENADEANLGILIPGVAGFTNDNAKHTKITITTYGVGINLTATPSGNLTSGGDNIPWHLNNTPAAGNGNAWRVKENAAGVFGNYFNWNDNTTVATKNKFTGSQLASTNALQTYTFYIQYYAEIDSSQSAGIYDETITYLPSLEY